MVRGVYLATEESSVGFLDWSDTLKPVLLQESPVGGVITFRSSTRVPLAAEGLFAGSLVVLGSLIA